MSIHKVGSALIAGFQAINMGLPISYEGEAFTAPTDSPWVELTNNPADNRVRTLGSNGEDIYAGFFQVNIYQPRNLGRRFLSDKAWDTIQYFKAGRRLVYQGQEVFVVRSVPGKIRPDQEDGADNVISITIYWNARFQRVP